MSKPREPKTCPECHEVFQPKRATQECCDRECASARRWRTSEATRTAWVSKSLATRRPRDLDNLKAILAQCKTAGDVYRLAFDRGFHRGYQARRRFEEKRARYGVLRRVA